MGKWLEKTKNIRIDSRVEYNPDGVFSSGLHRPKLSDCKNELPRKGKVIGILKNVAGNKVGNAKVEVNFDDEDIPDKWVIYNQLENIEKQEQREEEERRRKKEEREKEEREKEEREKEEREKE